MNLKTTIESFHELGEEMRGFIAGGQTAAYEEWNAALKLAQQQNGWFTPDNMINALRGIEPWLTKNALQQWAARYSLPEENKKPVTINVIMAGNIPLVGFHDFLSVLITGNAIQAKLSHTDSVLMNFITQKLIAYRPEWKNYITLADKLSSSANAVIATGSNNTARHFEYYFRNVPNIIRKNRNSIALLDGTETAEDLSMLGKDIFSYFGLGCRNVSKLYVPEGYDFSLFFRSIEQYKDVIQHNKYANNYTYNRTIYLMDGKVFTDNGFLAVIQEKPIPSPIAVLHFEEYKNLSSFSKQLAEQKEQIQCIAAKESVAKKLQLPIPVVGLGETQSPALTDYADGVDVIKFNLDLSNGM